MEVLKRARRPVKRMFENQHKELEQLLKKDVLEVDEINAKFKLFVATCEKLDEYDNKITNQMTEDNVAAEEENKEWDEISTIKFRAEALQQLKEKKVPSNTGSSINGDSSFQTKVRNFKLPTIEMAKFSGKLEDWLEFWSQFQKIDEDEHMCGSDKFWYLRQSLRPNSDAYKLASGYAMTNDNYPIVIEALKKQYANEDLQLQVYIRKLLKLIITNVKSKEKLSINDLFLKLDSHLRALKTLKLDKADPATWLFPLVEACLPEAVLDNWQRAQLSTEDKSKDLPGTRLDRLMEFVGREVQIKQRLEITRNFREESTGERTSKEMTRHSDPRSTFRKQDRRPVSTLSSCHVGDSKNCVLCDKKNHNTEDCFRAKNMRSNEKLSIMKRKGACFRCGGKHMASECKRTDIHCSNCGGKHFTVLCMQDFKRKQDYDKIPSSKRTRLDNDQDKRKDGKDEEVKTTTSSASMECSSEVALKTLLVEVGNGHSKRIVRAFIDDGCQRSYILKSTARMLKLPIHGTEKVRHSLFGGTETHPVEHHKYKLELRSLHGEFKLTAEVRGHHQLCGLLAWKKYPDITQELKEKGVVLSDGGGVQEIELLIGADIYPRLMTPNFKNLRCGAVAIKTKLGWTLMGTMPSEEEDDAAGQYLAMSVQDVGITRLWDLETIGIKEPMEQESKRRLEEMVREKFQEKIKKTTEGRYSVSLPWKDNLPILPENREVAYKRLLSASKKLKEKGLFERYDHIFKEWEGEGFIERVPAEERHDNRRIHYLPHRPVIKNSLTTPVRPVFDASCHVGKSASLNDCLHTGENLVQRILDLILKFRERRIGFVADIRKAFQMIGVEIEDRDVMRFLWWEDGKMEKVIEFRHARVMFGATCSPFILAAVIHFHLTNLPEERREMGMKLLSTLYVDNCVNSEDSIEAYHEFQKISVELLQNAGMELRMWLSNVDGFEDEATDIISVLGIMWDRKTDQLFINVKGILTPEKLTKRTVLSTVQKIFDPVGVLSPATLPMKCLLQTLWKTGKKWDEELGETEKNIFLKWCREIQDLGKIRIPRLATAGGQKRENWELHIFNDACNLGYATAVFLRIESEGVKISLLAAKTRVAPTKNLTIPKLELMAALIGARLTAVVKKALNLDRVKEFYWTDSMTVLAWIRRDDQWGTFVANRTREINALTNSSDWRHVPGSVNPADLPSRGCSPTKLLNSRWWEGPTWLKESEGSWPVSNETENENEICEEKRKSAAAAVEVSSSCISQEVRHSHSFDGYVRITAWVRRFLHNKFVKTEQRNTGPLTKEELVKAKMVFIRNLQQGSFPEEKRENLCGLEVVKDDWGILRVKTRIVYRDDPISFKYPVLLPPNAEVVRQLIRDYHRNYCHAGAGFLVMKLRENYWIIKARRTVKSVISKCLRCRRYVAKAVVPEAAPLPLDRIGNTEVFEVIGTDLAGPLILKNGTKIWLVIFTCAVYRAVHFELVKKVSTRAFINALEKFVEKYRRPTIIYSDNGTNFRGADNLFKLIDWKEVEQVDGVKQIKWKFNPVTSSWWGGWFERLIRTAKDLLRRTLGKRSVNYRELLSVVTTVTNVMNGRPLTYISESPDDLEALTPNLFLHPYGNVNFPEGDLTEAQQLRFRYNYVANLKKELKQRFIKEYLGMLVNHHPKKATRGLKVGELVLVGCDNQKRIDWPLGKVTGIISDYLARVNTAKGEIVRSVQRLYPLEMDNQDGNVNMIRETGRTTRSGRSVRSPVRFM